MSKSCVLSPARAAALRLLTEACMSGRYVRELAEGVCAAADLDARDASFARKLALGVTVTSGCLDDALDRALDDPRALDAHVRNGLRIAAYELLYLGTAPQVAVSQGVELVRGVSRAAAGLANAVLRRVAAEAPAFLAADDVPAQHRAMVSRARRAGLPTWLVRRIIASLGDVRAQAMFEAQLEPAPLSVQVNPVRADVARDALEADGAVPLGLPGSFAVQRVGALVRTGCFARADAVASDYHAQLIAAAATRAGSCLEIGAGRGTKTFMMMAHAMRRGLAHEHIALDLYEGKCRANAERIDRSGLGSIDVAAGDATDLDACLTAWDDASGGRVCFDTVIVDAPCSGTGTMRRHGEIPWRLTPAACDRELPQLQLVLLCAAAERVATGGELVYATCSVLRAENDEVITAFLASPYGGNFVLAPVAEALDGAGEAYDAARADLAIHADERGCFQSYPMHGAFDGHFCARFVRRDAYR